MSLLLSASELVREQPILFICMLRPDQDAPSWRSMEEIDGRLGGRYRSIMLQPLGAAQTDALLANLLGMQQFPVGMRKLIVDKAGGNPFFVEELIRSLIETGQIVRETSHWKAAGDEASMKLPDTLRGVLGARIDRLPEPGRHVLQMASVIGRTFDLQVLERLAKVEGLDRELMRLKEAGLVEGEIATRKSPARNDSAVEGEMATQDSTTRKDMTFRHVLIQEAAYELDPVEEASGAALASR